jgi:hypothetical protein
MFRTFIYLAALTLPVAIFLLFGIVGILTCVALAWLTLAISTGAEDADASTPGVRSIAHPPSELTAHS